MFTSRLERATGATLRKHEGNKSTNSSELNNAVKGTLHIKHLLAKQINTTQPLFKRIPIGPTWPSSAKISGYNRQTKLQFNEGLAGRSVTITHTP